MSTHKNHIFPLQYLFMERITEREFHIIAFRILLIFFLMRPQFFFVSIELYSKKVVIYCRKQTETIFVVQC